jgi:hypothetical protein
MKRWILVAAICVMAIASSQAVADTGGDAGSASAVAGSSGKRALNDFVVHFKVRYNRHGKPVKVVKFKYGKEGSENPAADDVPMECTEGSALTFTNDDAPWGPMKVRDHEFKGHFDGTGGEDGAIEVVIKGKFTHHNSRANGTLHITGDFTPDYHDCDSGVQTWQAGQS